MGKINPIYYNYNYTYYDVSDYFLGYEYLDNDKAIIIVIENLLTRYSIPNYSYYIYRICFGMGICGVAISTINVHEFKNIPLSLFLSDIL
jgi:hypothetical protein